MRKRIIILVFVVITIGIAVLLRIIFVCNGEKLKNVVYKSNNVIVQEVQQGNKNLIILGSGYSLSVDECDKVVHHDPLMILPSVDFKEETILSVFYPFESEGLSAAGEELSKLINSIGSEYDSVTLVGHSKCGVCFANAAKWIRHKDINIVTISAPFSGTPMADREAMLKELNWFEQFVYKLIFSDHAVDKDIMPDSEFSRAVDYSGLEDCTHINIVSKCPRRAKNPLDALLKYLDKIAHIEGDGIVPKNSQQQICYSNTIQKTVEATHATSLKIGVAIAKKLIEFLHIK